MSTATATRAPAPTGRAGTGNVLTGTATLVRFNLRRDRVRIPAWLAGITLVQVSAPSTYEGLYPSQADRLNQASVIGDNPAMKAMTGPGHGLDNYSYGAMMSNEYLGFMVIFVALMSVLMVIRHTRAEEETGRAELIRANVVGRYAPMTAALVTVAGANLVLGTLIALGMGSSGVESVDWSGSVVFGAAFTAVGLVFAGIAAVTAQLTQYARAASGMAGALIGVAYALRAIGDVGDSALSWLSPIGWAQASAPYVEDNWWPIGLALAATAALVIAAFTLSGRRDVGAGLRAERTGATTASKALGTPAGFAWRLQRASVVWWTIAMLVAGLAYGSAVDVMEDYADNQVIQDMMENIGGATITESWLSMIIALLAIVCTIFAVIAGLRPRREETSGRAELVLATGLSRIRWVATHVAIGTVGGLALLTAAGMGLGLGAATAMNDDVFFWRVLGATLAYAPALWVTAGLAITVFGVVPRAIGLAWALLGYAIFIVYFGALLQVPDWMQDLSPYTHIPRMPAEEFTASPLVILTVIAAALVATGLLGFRRRDLQAT
ncbi:ABC transporter permease [Plantactinospora sp. KLBMP9567]|uniref:ABC transporter permease n=1 Tax=Plantactinospora sp. KLBMP9567 TaxID=3085900 RepID=UPI002981E2D3|nr:ABC transporter permease [Plantactinospora sp. KLBMP9567]MDW5329587.1 ABC transporter permease [Plantactinospora sp. KLBMP9567]